MANPYGITLDGAWTKWATAYGVSETIAAALYLISENRKADEVVVKLTPGEIELVTDIVQHWPDCFPRGAFAAVGGGLGLTLWRPLHGARLGLPGQLQI